MLKSILTVIKPIVLKKKPMPIGLFVVLKFNKLFLYRNTDTSPYYIWIWTFINPSYED